MNNGQKRDLTSATIRIYSEFPLTYPGGVERLVKLFGSFFDKEGLKTFIIQNIKDFYQRPPDPNYSILGLNVTSMEFERYGFPRFLYQDFPNIEDIRKSIDSIHMVFIRRVPPRGVLRELYESKSKIIFCLHGIALEKLRITSPLIMLHQFLIRYKLRHLASFAKGNIFIQVLTPSQYSYLIKNSSDNKNIFLIENKINSTSIGVKRNDDEFYVIFVGRMENLQKGIKLLRDVIFYSYRINPEIKFRLVGSGSDSGILSKLPPNATYLGKVKDYEKQNLVSSSNIALITSLLEPYSLVALEYLNAGVPIVSTPASGPSYIISKSAYFGKSASFRAKDLATVLNTYFNLWKKDKYRYFIMKNDISKKAAILFREEEMLKSYEEMVERIAGMP